MVKKKKWGKVTQVLKLSAHGLPQYLYAKTNKYRKL